MPKGFEGIRQYRKEIDEKAASSVTFAKNLWFKLADGESATVRFGEQGEDINFVLVHRIPGKGKFPDNIPCLDQHNKGIRCPACEHPDQDISRRTLRGYITMIWRNAPVYKKDAEGKRTNEIIDHEDQVAIWSQGVRVFGMLDELDSEYKGLMSRPFKIKRTGSRVDNTTYTILPSDEEALSAKEATMLSDEKPDLSFYITPPTFEEMQEKLGVSREDVVSTEDVTFFKNDPFAEARKKREAVK